MGERTYPVDIGTQRVDLPLVSLNEQLALALLITVDMGVEFMSRAGAELAEIIRPYDVDIVATVATMGATQRRCGCRSDTVLPAALESTTATTSSRP